jgi:hypothetical protein
MPTSTIASPASTAYVCTTCGTQYPPSAAPPASCRICDDDRQYVPRAGQRWTTLDTLRQTHRNAYRRLEPGLLGIGTEPTFAIGQRALLVQTPGGNVLWDCITYVDQATVDIVAALGGIATIAISHPHYYTTCVEWAHAFGCEVLLHEADRAWLMRPDPAVRFWSGDRRTLHDGLTIVRCGGHFDGGSVLHWPAGGLGRGALLTGDIVQVLPGEKLVSFMYSYPMLVPLGATRVQAIVDALAPFQYDRIYGAWWDRVIDEGGRQAVKESAARYLRHLAP